MFRHSLVMLVGLAVAGPAPAASWAEAMFTGYSCDFGAVPRGAILTHPFWLTNNTKSTVTISGVRVSCGCTTAWAQQTELAPGQSTAVMASMDTHRFQGDKVVTIFVDFSQPAFEEVRLWVKSNSREDILMSPDSFAFGEVKKGNTPSATLQLSLVGTENWRVTAVSCESNYVYAAVKPLQSNGTEANYQVTARLRPDTPPGRWYTEIWLQTNNPAAPRIFVPVNVVVK